MTNDKQPRDRLDKQLQTVHNQVSQHLQTTRAHLRLIVDTVHETLHDYVMREPDRVVVETTMIAFAVLLQLLGRYVPEYLRVLGAGPVVIGLVGSIGILIGVASPYLRQNLTWDAELVKWIRSVHRLTVISVLASLGLVLWLLASQVDAASSGVIWAWGVIILGVFMVGVWPSFGFAVAFPITTPTVTARRPIQNCDTGRRYWGGVVAGFLLMAIFLTLFATFLTGFQMVLAIAIAIGLSTALFQYYSRKSAADERTTGGKWPDTAELVSLFRSMPIPRRHLLIGDTLVQFAVGMISVFIIIVVISVLKVDIALFGQQFRSDAFFGLLVAIELVVALLSLSAVRWLAGKIKQTLLVAVNFLIISLFPLFLVSTPADPLVVGVLFAFFGLRAIGRPARRALLSEMIRKSTNEELADQSAADEKDTKSQHKNETKRKTADNRPPHGPVEHYRVARNAATIPSALLGGLLYAVSPQLAFGLATVIGVVGVRELLYFIRPPQRTASRS